MGEVITQEQEIKENVNSILNLLSEGKFIEAMETYLDDNVELYEGNNPAKVGKAFCIDEENKLLSTVTAFGGYKVISGPAVQGNTSFYEAVMEFTTDDGTNHRFEQVVRSVWKDGKVINERYYHA